MKSTMDDDGIGTKASPTARHGSGGTRSDLGRLGVTRGDWGRRGGTGGTVGGGGGGGGGGRQGD